MTPVAHATGVHLVRVEPAQDKAYLAQSRREKMRRRERKMMGKILSLRDPEHNHSWKLMIDKGSRQSGFHAIDLAQPSRPAGSGCFASRREKMRKREKRELWEKSCHCDSQVCHCEARSNLRLSEKTRLPRFARNDRKCRGDS